VVAAVEPEDGDGVGATYVDDVGAVRSPWWASVRTAPNGESAAGPNGEAAKVV
jgi:hypothetical protein